MLPERFGAQQETSSCNYSFPWLQPFDHANSGWYFFASFDDPLDESARLCFGREIHDTCDSDGLDGFFGHNRRADIGCAGEEDIHIHPNPQRQSGIVYRDTNLRGPRLRIHTGIYVFDRSAIVAAGIGGCRYVRA